jgi:hypothetical protein
MSEAREIWKYFLEIFFGNLFWQSFWEIYIFYIFFRSEFGFVGFGCGVGGLGLGRGGWGVKPLQSRVIVLL